MGDSPIDLHLFVVQLGLWTVEDDPWHRFRRHRRGVRLSAGWGDGGRFLPLLLRREPKILDKNGSDESSLLALASLLSLFVTFDLA